MVVVGAGQAGVQFADSLRGAGFTAALTVVDEESGLPYQRPPLSKAHLAAGPDPVATPLRGEAWYERNNVELRRGSRVVSIDRDRREVLLDDGSVLVYTGLVLATGATSRRLDVPGRDLLGVHHLRSLADAQGLRAELDAAGAVVVVGAGFIGLEFAAAARARGLNVTVLEASARPLARAVSPMVSTYVTAWHRANGTDLRLGESVSSIEGTGGRVSSVVTTAGARLAADVVVVGVGAVPRDALARACGLRIGAGVGGGIVVDSSLRTDDPRIFAIGDCARYPSEYAGGPARLESVQNAAGHGTHLARMLAGGQASAYNDVPWFWSNQGSLRLQIAGLVAESDEQVISGAVADGKFSVLSYRDGRLRAVESINSPGEHLAARRLLDSARSPEPHEFAGGASLTELARKLVARSS